MRDRRRQKRMHIISYVKVREKSANQTVGRVMDITTEGMRLYGKDPLKPRSRRQFRMILPNVTTGSPEIFFDADIIWCRKDRSADFYDAGVHLIGVTPENRQVIEDFINYTLPEDRWLAVEENLQDQSKDQ